MVLEHSTVVTYTCAPITRANPDAIELCDSVWLYIVIVRIPDVYPTRLISSQLLLSLL